VGKSKRAGNLTDRIANVQGQLDTLGVQLVERGDQFLVLRCQPIPVEDR
jgi:hypothetical protein